MSTIIGTPQNLNERTLSSSRHFLVLVVDVHVGIDLAKSGMAEAMTPGTPSGMMTRDGWIPYRQLSHHSEQ